MRTFFLAAVLILTSILSEARAQVELPIDTDTLPSVTFLGFGDSITHGVGDNYGIGQFVEDFNASIVSSGYPTRLSATLGIPVINSGEPGEEFLQGGVQRYPSAAIASPANVIGFMEGANDAIHRASSLDYRHRVQKIINATSAAGKTIVLITTPVPCCEHIGSAPFIVDYNNELRDLARINQVVLADAAFAWTTTCVSASACELFVRPNGIHPNSGGYDILAQTVLAALFGVDLFVEGGAAKLEETLGLEPGTIKVKPVPAPAA